MAALASATSMSLMRGSFLSTSQTIARQMVRRSAISTTRSLSTVAVPRLSQSVTSSVLGRFFRPQPLLRQGPRRNFTKSWRLREQAPSPNPTPSLNSPQPSLSLSQRLKKLSREYGWSAFGVYMALSALDFPFCFLAVRVLGTERIGRWEHAVIDTAKNTIYYPVKRALGLEDGNVLEEGGHTVQDGVRQVVKAGEQEETKSNQGWGVEEADEAAHQAGATLWTQLVLAYAIHKSFIFIRVPLTAAVTPKVVKTLRGWGWNIGKRPSKAAKAGVPR